MLGRPIFTGEYQYVFCVCVCEREREREREGGLCTRFQ